MSTLKVGPEARTWLRFLASEFLRDTAMRSLFFCNLITAISTIIHVDPNVFSERVGQEQPLTNWSVYPAGILLGIHQRLFMSTHLLQLPQALVSWESIRNQQSASTRLSVFLCLCDFNALLSSHLLGQCCLEHPKKNVPRKSVKVVRSFRSILFVSFVRAKSRDTNNLSYFFKCPLLLGTA